MTMKLSEKGFNKIVNNLLNLRKLEFAPDDFESGCCQNGKDHVTLTVDEAKDVLHSLNCAWSRCPVKAECKDLIKKKIKQAEDK